MKVLIDRRVWLVVLLSALLAPSIGCVTAPKQDQEWMTVDEFTRRWPKGELGDIPGPRPVLILPKGSEIPVRLSRGQVGALELSEDAAFSLKVNKPLYINLDNFTASDDKVNWSSMEGVLFPLRAITFSLHARQGTSEIAVWFRDPD